MKIILLRLKDTERNLYGMLLVSLLKYCYLRVSNAELEMLMLFIQTLLCIE